MFVIIFCLGGGLEIMLFSISAVVKMDVGGIKLSLEFMESMVSGNLYFLN